MSQWQPIETAPKDGTRILLGKKYFSAEWDGKEAKNQTWEFIPAVAWWDGEEQRWTVCPNCIVEFPTHWQPLPESPK